ncbi:MAG: type II CRISPR RNA-guided endonuclease Cas9 [Acidimicrobiia bacterium]
METVTNSRFWVGIDVGTNSVGCAAIEVDSDGMPIRILNGKVQVHDSGVDPQHAKTATTRLAVSGVARRTRRLVRRRRKRLINLDKQLKAWGWWSELTSNDPYFPWRVRARLVDELIEDASERQQLLAVALRHIARHRGWRNPWLRIESLFNPSEPSKFLTGFRERVETETGRYFDHDVTAAELAVAALKHDSSIPLRGGKTANLRAEKTFSFIGSKLEQSDNANEILRMAETQQLSIAQTEEIIRLVFAAESPRGSYIGRIGKDPLPGQGSKYRAAKASDSFQRYRIASLIANLRLKDGSSERPLNVRERNELFDYLMNVKAGANPQWLDVAEHMGWERSQLRGTATITADGERAAARPPVHNTNEKIGTCKVRTLKSWWPDASPEARDAVVAVLSDGLFDDDSAAGAEARELIESLTDEELVALDTIKLPPGRAAYSSDSLNRLTRRILEDGVDLHEARKLEFGVDDSWAPPAEPIGAPLGNPAVDRVLKIVARWLGAVEAEWGAPEKVVIEHVRSAFGSEAAAREHIRETERRFQQNQQQMRQLAESQGISGVVRRSDLFRYQAIVRQNGECLYCGTAIDYTTAEMDHIVPRAGIGSTNKRENLVAVCSRCNKSKSNTPFAAWAARTQLPGVSVPDAIERTNHWNSGPGETAKRHRDYVREVQARLRKTSEDEEFDGRSLESVAWMANSLRQRIEAHYRERFPAASTKVSVYQGRITAEARRASGIEKQIPFIGEAGKTRLDRRHHFVDAAVVTLLDESIARTLAERVNLRDSERNLHAPETWKDYTGSSERPQARFENWVERMQILLNLISSALNDDEIPVMEDLRLRLANGTAHKDTILPLVRMQVGDAMSLELIDRASTPALWMALTLDPDFDEKEGLPANPNRQIRVRDQHLGPYDEIGFFRKLTAAIAVRDGYAEIGSTIHHARVYRIDTGKKPKYAMLRVFTTDLIRHRNDDLFSAPLLPQSISMRTADKTLRKALAEGTATELGWIVVGDELELDMSSFTTGDIGDFLKEYPGTTRWKIDGLMAPTRLRLRPVILASEGLGEEPTKASKTILDRPGWLPYINSLWNVQELTVIRRDALGRERWSSAAGLPVSWRVENSV